MQRNILDLSKIKNKISEIKGKGIDITINRGRKKIDSYEGVIENIYQSVFTVKILNDKLLKNLTCSYSEVLCGDVKISVR